jgi:hypothetical protein
VNKKIRSISRRDILKVRHFLITYRTKYDVTSLQLKALTYQSVMINCDLLKYEISFAYHLSYSYISISSDHICSLSLFWSPGLPLFETRVHFPFASRFQELTCVTGDEMSVAIGRDFKGVKHSSEYYSANVSECSTDAYPQCSSKYCRTENTQLFETNIGSGPLLLANVTSNFCIR